MLKGQRIVVVMPAYNAARTLRQTYDEVIGHDIVDEIILVDDASNDQTAAIARTLDRVRVEVHPKNRGYGGNQKTCYRLALAAGADVVIMLHPDYQYTPTLIPAMASMVTSGLYPCVLASRILGGGALRGGMPWWKYIANRLLTLSENILLGAKLSEYHTGYRAFARKLLESLPLEKNSDDFVFDNQMLAQIIWLGHPIGEITCPAKYMPEASSINFRRSVRYGLGCLKVAIDFIIARWRETGTIFEGLPRAA
ncbi:MAG: glycosyl transferase family 2 [Verrucomicrobia bacterium]|nr:MAG: glycosyl transferase family 2 [Verrucomicrobiota bacterium]